MFLQQKPGIGGHNNTWYTVRVGVDDTVELSITILTIFFPLQLNNDISNVCKITSSNVLYIYFNKLQYTVISGLSLHMRK